MSRTIILSALALTVALALQGCGKSPEEKRKEEDLRAGIMKVHEFQMASMRKMKELSGQIDAQMIEDDSLARAFPKKMAGHSSDDLKGAEDRLDAIQSAMDNWMTMPHPYDPAMGHEEAMNALMKEKRELESATADALAAIDSATSALAAHRRFADALLAAGTKPSGKGRH